jgi:hypothetical protein
MTRHPDPAVRGTTMTFMTTPAFLGDRVACDGCAGVANANQIADDDGRLLCPECRPPADEPDGAHAGHERVATSGRRTSLPGAPMIGYLVCVDCTAIVGPLPVCGQPTLRGHPCRTPIRTDLGYRSCWSHGEGRGRTSTPKRRMA